MAKEVGRRWQALSESEREEWELKEDALRKEAGFDSDSSDDEDEGQPKRASASGGQPRSRAMALSKNQKERS